MEEFTLEIFNSTSPTTTSIMTMVTTLVTGLAMVSLLPLLLLLSIKHWINHQQVSTYLQFPCPGSTRILLRFSGYYWKYFINNNIILQDAHAKKQKEIRDLMKKRREKAVLVDRISRWLFPTSFILLNIVYWALFGDHDLWWSPPPCQTNLDIVTAVGENKK